MTLRKTWLRAAHCAVLAIAVGVAACGGDTPRPPTKPPPIQPPAGGDPTPPPPQPVAPPTLSVSRILAFGDSITEGVDSPPILFDVLSWNLPLAAGRPQSYPFKLKGLLDARYTGQAISVFNGGWAGRQAREDRER